MFSWTEYIPGRRIQYIHTRLVSYTLLSFVLFVPSFAFLNSEAQTHLLQESERRFCPSSLQLDKRTSVAAPTLKVLYI